MKIDAIDHIVLTVRDITTTCQFYQRVLGMTVITSEEGRKALTFGSQKFNLHQLGREFEPKAEFPTAGSIDICLVTSTPMTEVIKHLHSNCVDIIEGPVQRSGAVGSIVSVYLRDPDSNLIEISNYIKAQ